MSFLQKMFGSNEVPQWALPMSKQLFREFQSDILTSLSHRSLNPKYDWQNGHVSIDPNIENGPSNAKIFFINVVETYKSCDPVERKIHTSDFISRILTGLLEKRPDLKQSLDRLMIRIYDLEFADSIRCEVYKEVGQNLMAGIVLDLDHSVHGVTKLELEKSGMTLDDLYDIARRNLIEHEIPEIQKQNGTIGLLRIISTEMYGASFVTILEDHTEPDKTYWVATPNRDMTLIVEPVITGQDALAEFMNLAGKISSGTPNHYILPFVLEYRNGVFRDLCKRVDNRIELL